MTYVRLRLINYLRALQKPERTQIIFFSIINKPTSTQFIQNHGNIMIYKEKDKQKEAINMHKVQSSSRPKPHGHVVATN